jgi:hypothetical protein
VLGTAGPGYGQSTEGRGSAKEPSYKGGDSAPVTREELLRLLKGYPPSFAQVLQLDPTLLTSEEYLRPYPQLAEFLKEHPEIARNSVYFLGNPEYPYNIYQRQERITPAEKVLEGFVIFGVTGLIIGTLFWIARTFIQHRRWLRLSRLQTDANTRLMDRFTSNEDLLNFIQTPAGARFLESSAVPAEPRSIGAPVGRILWSTQIGFVLLAVGAGFELLSSRVSNGNITQPELELGRVFDTFGILLLMAGIGFIVSAFLSYALSQKLGLLDSMKMAPPPGDTVQKPQ